MNYYEELGVAPDATELEIRKAHRRLVKLMHPDAQPDHNLKMVAETQMRRLNSIVSTLLDEEQRRAYDDELHSARNPVYRQSNVSGWRAIPWWLASTVGAVVLTLAAVWVWADHLGSGLGNRGRMIYVSPATHGQATNSQTERVPPPSEIDSPSTIGSASYKPPEPDPTVTPEGGISTAIVPEVPPDPKGVVPNKTSQATGKNPPALLPKTSAPQLTSKAPDQQPGNNPAAKQSPAFTAKSDPPATPQSSPTTKKAFNLPAGTVIASAKTPGRNPTQLPPPPIALPSGTHDYSSSVVPLSNLPVAAPPPKPAIIPAAVSTGIATANPRDPLEGEWVYAPKEPEKRKVGFYPPEFIDLKLFGAGDPGNLKGQYSAKYVVTDRPVSPEVTFDLASVAKGSRKFVWQSSSGAKGTLSIDPIDDRTIRIDWRTTSAVRGPALTSGTATLVRRQ